MGETPMTNICSINLESAVLCAECNQITEGDGTFGCPNPGCGSKLLLNLARVLARIEDNLDLKVIWSSDEKLRQPSEEKSA
jgi:hypothetical protein